MATLRRLLADDSESNETPRSSDHARPAGRVLDAEYLIRQAFATDPDAGMALLFQHYYGPLCSHAVRFVASKAIAEDLVSDVYYEFQVGQLYQGITTSFRAFLFTVVRNRAFDHVRAELHRSLPLENAAILPLHADQQPDSITQFEELYHDVESALNALPLRRRQVYVMHRFEGKKYGEIAEELGLSVRTVEAQMYRAIHQVRAFLAEKWLVGLLLLGWCA